MPNRIIKESVCTSDTINQMTWFEECFYTRLWTACDDYGRMDARPAILKSKLFPLKDRLSLKDIQNALSRMADIGCVRLYECDSKPYLYLPSWEVHQQVRAKRSKYPAPNESCNHMISDDIKCTRNPIQSESESESESESPPTPQQGAVDVFFAYADGDDSLLSALRDYEAMRNKIKKPMTDRAKKQLCAKLDNLSGNFDRVELINEAILHCWQSVYPPNRGNENGICRSSSDTAAGGGGDSKKWGLEAIEL